MSFRRRVITTVAVFSLAAPLLSAVGAQRDARDSASVAPTDSVVAAPARTESALGAPIMPTGVTFRHADASATMNAKASMTSNATQPTHNQATMIIGGAAILVGAVVGGKAGTVIMVTGAVVGLYGLWRYMQ